MRRHRVRLRGHTDPPTITQATARAFFATVTPKVRNTLSEKMQRKAWMNHLDSLSATLAVRSLGPDPMFLAGTALSDTPITAVRRHLHDAQDVQRTLFPVAVRSLPVASIPAVAAYRGAITRRLRSCLLHGAGGGICWMDVGRGNSAPRRVAGRHARHVASLIQRARACADAS